FLPGQLCQARLQLLFQVLVLEPQVFTLLLEEDLRVCLDIVEDVWRHATSSPVEVESLAGIEPVEAVEIEELVVIEQQVLPLIVQGNRRVRQCGFYDQDGRGHPGKVGAGKYFCLE